MQTSHSLFLSLLLVYFGLQKSTALPAAPAELRCIINASNGEIRMEQMQAADRAAGIINMDCCRLWPGGRIYYRNADMPEQMWSYIVLTMELWENNTCVKFVESGRTHKGSVLRINKSKDRNKCSANVGYQPHVAESEMFLGINCFITGATVLMHEFGHVIGLIHEVQRKDRDQYVTVQNNNILSNLKHNFDKNLYSSTNLDTPYDYCSIMHYDQYNGKAGDLGKTIKTIKTKDPYYQYVIGHQYGISFYDIKAVNKMYNCANHCSRNLNCRNDECFLNKNCECVCPRKRAPGECDVYGFYRSPKVEKPEGSIESGVETVTREGFSKTKMDKFCSTVEKGSKPMDTHTCRHVTCVKNGHKIDAHVFNYNICPSGQFCDSAKCTSTKPKRPREALTDEQWKVVNQQCKKELGPGYEPYCSAMNIGTHPDIATGCTNNLCDAVLCAGWQRGRWKFTWAYLSEGSNCGNGKICRRKRCQ